MKKLPPLPIHRRPTHPGVILSEEFLKPLGISVSAFATRIGLSRNAVSEIINGRRGVSAKTAMRLSRALGTTEGVWLNLQLMCDMWDAQHSKEAKQIAKIEPIEYVTSSELVAN
jgi:addiction module HigA family antidote